MRKWAGVALLLAMVALFLVMNRGAYRGYFADDEMDNLSWTPYLTAADMAKGLTTPLFYRYNFRPVGHYYFHLMDKWFGLDFAKHIAIVHLLHFLNAWLLWVLMRKLGAPPLSAAVGVALFAFHMALFDALWKTMYVFDVLCGTFSLACVILWISRRWVLSFVAFWLAYKSKELAVMLPVVLAAYELLLGSRRWKPLVPFFLVSLSFGIQGMIFNPHRDNDYTFRFTPAALARTSTFYAGRVLLIPFAGFALLAVPFLTRNRRVWFGLAMSLAVAAPLLFLPGRMFSAYCYVPFLGLAVAVSAIDLTKRRVQLATAGFFLLWIPWNYQQMRVNRRAKLAKDDEVRAWVAGVRDFARRSPETNSFVYSGAPGEFARWGIEGAIKYYFRHGDIDIRWIEDAEAKQTMRRERLAILNWDGRKLQVASRGPGTRDAAYLSMSDDGPVWQLGDGWFGDEGDYRWIRPEATARLHRPGNAGWFELKVNISPDQLATIGPQQVKISLNGESLPPCRFGSHGWQTERWKLPPREPGTVEVRFDVEPGLPPGNDGRVLGVAIGAFGFLEGEKK